VRQHRPTDAGAPPLHNSMKRASLPTMMRGSVALDAGGLA
jgi:hypothetical protein